jgi:hypothetical protein
MRDLPGPHFAASSPHDVTLIELLSHDPTLKHWQRPLTVFKQQFDQLLVQVVPVAPAVSGPQLHVLDDSKHPHGWH